MDGEAVRLLAAGLAAGLGAVGPGIGVGVAGSGALQGIARNPDARGVITTNMILAFAFAESIAIYALVVAIVLLFVI